MYISLPEHISLVELDRVKGVVNNLGNCEIENLDINLDKSLQDIIEVEYERTKNIDINSSIEFLLIKKLKASKVSNLLIQGFNIKIPDRSIETFDGILTFGALVSDQLASEEKVSIKVDVVKSVSTIDVIKTKIPIFVAIFLLFVGIFYVFYRKIKKKRH